ncbi:putative aspartic protease [Quercus suber]|uniref:Aspartic protease n=1 Tax=Quercus suber TaxID=58331 RepID=A0AAW0KJU9_QUESU
MFNSPRIRLSYPLDCNLLHLVSSQMSTNPPHTRSTTNDDRVAALEVSTPLIVTKDLPSYYYVTIEGISVGDTNVPFNSSGKVSKGNTFIDLGTPKFGLLPDFCDCLVVEVKKQISIYPIKDDSLLGTRLCYRTKITNENGPILTVRFEDANVELKPIQTFNRPLKEYEYYCFGITSTANSDLASWDGLGIYGNYFQANLLIGYDLETMMVSFKPTDCTKH